MKNKSVKHRFWVLLGSLVTLILAFSVCMTVWAADTITITGSKDAKLNDLSFTQTLDGSGNGSVTLNGMKITLVAKTNTETGCGTTHTPGQTTVTITNDHTSLGVTISYKINSISLGSVTLNGSSSLAAGSTGSVTLAAGGSVSFKVASESSEGSTATGVVEITNVQWEEATYNVTVNAPSNGTVTVQYDSVTKNITENTKFEFKSSRDVILNATADKNYSFFGWYDEETGTYINFASNATFNFKQAYTLTPVFKLADQAVFLTGGKYYLYLDEAISVANASTSDKNVVLYQEGVAYSKNSGSVFSIPSGVALILPYASGQTAYGNNSKLPNANAEYVSSGTVNLDPKAAWIFLRIKSGDTLSVENGGKLIIGGRMRASESFPSATVQASSSDKTGVFARLELAGGDSQLTLNEGSVLSCCGYITGAVDEAEGKIADGGTIVANGAASIYQAFGMFDFRGGAYTAAGAGGAASELSWLASGYIISESKMPGGEFVFPTMQYTLRNIQVTCTMGSTAKMYGYVGIDADNTITYATSPIIGSDGILKITKEITIYYHDDEVLSSRPYIGLTELHIKGGATFQKMILSVSIANTDATISSDVATFFLPYNYRIILDDDDADPSSECLYTVANSLAVLPGAELIVKKGAKLSVSATNANGKAVKLIVFDGLYDHQCAYGDVTASVNGTTLGNGVTGTSSVTENKVFGGSSWYGMYPTPSNLIAAGFDAMARFVVDGTFEINGTFGGIIQTTGESEGKIIIKSGAVLQAQQQIGVVGDTLTTSSWENGFTGASLHTLPAMIYDVNGNCINLYSLFGSTISETCTLYGDNKKLENLTLSFTETVYGDDDNPTTPSGTETFTYTGDIDGIWYTHRVVYQDVDGVDIVDYQHDGKTLDYTVYYISATGDIYSPLTDPELFAYDDGVYLYETSWGTPSALQTPTAGSPYYLIKMVKGDRNGIFAELTQKYRLNSYIWFNGLVSIADSIAALDTVKGQEFTVYAADGVTVLDEIQAFEAEGTVYVVRKILSNDITSKISFRLMIDGLLTNVMTIDFESYDAGTLSALKTAMLDYGRAADLLFDKEWTDDNTVAPFFETWSGLKKATKNQNAPATDAYNDVLSVKTKGANFVFDESLMMKIRFQVENVADYTSEIVQIGVLVGDPAGILTTLEGEHTAAYILYNNTALGKDDASVPEGLPTDYEFSSGTNSAITDITELNFDEPLVVSFDLLSKEYTKNFGVRPYLVLNIGTEAKPQYVAVYGAQYTYGFDAYVYTMYHKESSALTASFDDKSLNPDAFKNFLVYAWKYAEASAAAYKES